MTRRDPDLAKSIPSYIPSVIGPTGLLPAISGCAYLLRSVTVASNGGAGTAVLSIAGIDFETIAVEAGATEQVSYVNYELPIGSGLDVTTSTDMALTAWYSKVDETPGITKGQARANTYNAWKTQRAAGEQAIRAPNRFGTQVEG